ncbi:MAG: PilN domain-containing protein [Gammaproteobacteria bacterium]
MAKINLLPWREAQRKEKQQEFFVMLGAGAAVAVLAVLLVHFQVEAKINGQERRNDFLKNEIVVLDEKIKEIKKLDATRRALVDRMEVIQNLQATRPGIVHLFDEVVNTLPSSVHLTELTQNGNKIKIAGKAESNARVSSYMRNIEESEWLTKPKLSIISTDENDDGLRVSSFSLKLAQTNPESELEEE